MMKLALTKMSGYLRNRCRLMRSLRAVDVLRRTAAHTRAVEIAPGAEASWAPSAEIAQHGAEGLVGAGPARDRGQRADPRTVANADQVVARAGVGVDGHAAAGVSQFL